MKLIPFRDTCDRVAAMREASSTQRCHTIPHHGTYSVGQHGFDATMLLLALKPDASATLVKFVLTHDMAERWVGDVPAPTKWMLPEFTRHLDDLEEQVRARLFPPNLVVGEESLSPEDRRWFRAVDLIEFWLWCLDQAAMGNRSADCIGGIVKRIILSERPDDTPREAILFVREYHWRRTSERPDMEAKT